MSGALEIICWHDRKAHAKTTGWAPVNYRGLKVHHRQLFFHPEQLFCTYIIERCTLYSIDLLCSYYTTEQVLDYLTQLFEIAYLVQSS